MADLVKNVSFIDRAFTSLLCMLEYACNPKEKYFEARCRSLPPETKDVRLKNKE